MYYIGLMSGTSVDGIDAALVAITEDEHTSLIAAHRHALPTKVREKIQSLVVPGDNELERAGELDVALGELCAEAVKTLLAKAGLSARKIHAIGSHGQTLRHHPAANHPFSLQIGDPAVITERTGITTVADFRPRDLAAGGQGAPLAPAFHRAAFHAAGKDRVIVNIGGIANLSRLPATAAVNVYGFDTGPGNTLLDGWVNRHLDRRYDRAGAWAASGKVVNELLAKLLADPYFERPPPKSTGREYFNLAWLDRVLHKHGVSLPPDDVQATLTRLTADSIVQAIHTHIPAADEIYICGGGVHNALLMTQLRAQLDPVPVFTTEVLGIPPDWVEAAAFAWLAYRTLHGKAGNLPSATGAKREVILGGIWQAVESRK